MTYLQLNGNRSYPVGRTAIRLPIELYIPTTPSPTPTYETEGLLVHACVEEKEFVMAIRAGIPCDRPHFHFSVCHARQRGQQTSVFGETIYGDNALSIDNIMSILCARNPAKRLRQLAAKGLDDEHEKRMIEAVDRLYQTQQDSFGLLQQIKNEETPNLATWRDAKRECLLIVSDATQKLIDTARILRSRCPGQVVEWRMIETTPSLFRQAASPHPQP